MTLSRGAQRTVIAIFFALLAAVYASAFLAPTIGLLHDDAAYLIAAESIAAGRLPPVEFPPLFPAILALFTLVSRQTQWLKLLPLACSAGWLALTRNLLRKMGASRNDSLLLIGLAAASPAIVFLSTNLMAECLFALLITATLLALLEERALLAGLFAGLAALTQTAGIALIVACILTFAARQRFRRAVIFTVVAMAMVAPWFGWSLARNHASNILASLPVSEKLVVLAHNFIALITGPFSLLTGFNNTLAVAITVLMFLWSLYRRRQLLPDLFIAFYCMVLLCRTWPPQLSLAPILPLMFWIVWRAFRLIRLREALAALVLIAACLPLWADATRLVSLRTDGYFPISGQPVDNWTDMQKLFSFIRANTAPDTTLLANLDGAFYLNTGRRTVRGFSPDPFSLFYAPRPSAVTPDQLSNAIRRAQVAYVALTPDRGLAESASFHTSVDALERGGVLDPVNIPGTSRDYRLLKVSR